jgi:signal transduction histidine kinase
MGMDSRTGRSAESADSDESILLALRPGFDRDLLEDWLDSLSGYTVVTRDPGDRLPDDYDLCILDGAALARSGSDLRSRQVAAAPVLLPCLFVVSDAEAGHAAGRPDSDEPPAFVSDIVTLPVDQSVLHRRIENLLDTRRATARLAARERQLANQNERLERFASMVSHDLRNPLNVAKGHVDIARNTTENAELDTAKTALDRMNALIDDLLALARQGRPTDGTEPVNLSAVADQCWRVVDTVDASLDIADTDYTLDADADRLQQLLENLYRNSVEHGSTDSRPKADDSVEHGSTDNRRAERAGDSVEHGSTNGRSAADYAGHGVTVRVGTLDDGDGFYVEDDGSGIPAADHERIFESGYSTAGDGTGFGLAIVREVADAHDWTITVSESEAGGARFEINT